MEGCDFSLTGSLCNELNALVAEGARSALSDMREVCMELGSDFTLTL